MFSEYNQLVPQYTTRPFPTKEILFVLLRGFCMRCGRRTQLANFV
jgi:hypothetical protein